MNALVLPKVEALIARAVDAGASEEEQRTSAWIACRLIHTHGLLGRAAPVPHVDVVYVDREPRTRRVVIRSKYTGHCRGCGDAYGVGFKIAWSKSDGAVCIHCHNERKAA